MASEPSRSSGSSLPVIGVVLAGLLLVAGILLPVRITYGAGSFRCGHIFRTLFAAGPDCRVLAFSVRLPQLAVVLVAVLAPAAMAWLLGRRQGPDRWLEVRSWVVPPLAALVGSWWALVVVVGVYSMTGAYEPPGGV